MSRADYNVEGGLYCRGRIITRGGIILSRTDYIVEGL